MPDELFPKEIIDNTAEANFGKHSLQTKIIYSTVLLIVIVGIAVLPIIDTTVSISSRGVIESLTGRNQVTSPVSGTIKTLYIKENGYVEKGQVIAVVACPTLNERLRHNRHQQQEYKQYLHDLVLLGEMDSSSVFSSYDLISLKYKRVLLTFKNKMRGISQKVVWIRQKYKRKKKLFARKFISKSSFEKVAFDLKNIQNKLDLTLKQKLKGWQIDLISYRNKLGDLKSEENKILQKKEKHIIKASVSGSVVNMKGIYEGGTVYTNQTFAVISPDTRLIVECYIRPSDIGLIKQGMEVRYQISAYDFNQWGILTGNVLRISKDITMMDNKPVFIVEASLDKAYLELQNGYRGNLKKGMTLQARFTVAKRSLFQLLFDNIDDWLNPQWDQPDRQVQQASM